MRVLFALPGLHRVHRGAEVAFISIATEMAKAGDEVTLIGSGRPEAGRPYRFIHAGAIGRERFERFPSLASLRTDTAYEEASFAPALLAHYRPSAYDVTFTCSYPFTNWVLRRPAGSRRPAHIFVTQNGDWPARSNDSEYRFFGCEGLVCTNPDYEAANRDGWRTALIPNGVAVDRFGLGPPERARFGIPEDPPVILMVSALIDSKRVADGVRAVAALDGVQLVIAGDGPLRDSVDALARDLLPGRYNRVVAKAADMPALYRSADVFLHLSRDEAFGNVYVEALACGLPVVAHDIPRVRWIVGDSEFLVDTDDPVLLGDTLRAALRAGSGRAEARVARAAAFNWPSVAERYRTFAAEVVRDWTARR